MPDEVINIVIEDQVEQININVNDFSTSKIISTDVGNAAELGTDGGIFVPPSAGGGVTSAFGRTGDVVASLGDYDTSLVTEVVDKKYVTDAEKLVLANTSGNNTGDQDLSGLEPAFSKNTAFNKDFGTDAGTVAQGNDARLSDARTPLAHTHLQNEVVGLVTDLGNKLDKDISTLPAVSLPLVDTDKLIVNRAGVDYSVDKSELGGGDSFMRVSTTNSETLTGTTANTILVADVLIPANTFQAGDNAYFSMSAERTVITSGNTGIGLAIAPTSGITDPSAGALTSTYKLLGAVMITTNKYVNTDHILKIKGTNQTVITAVAAISDKIQDSTIINNTNIDWSVNNYLYIYVNNVVATTETKITGFRIERKRTT